MMILVVPCVIPRDGICDNFTDDVRPESDTHDVVIDDILFKSNSHNVIIYDFKHTL